MWQCGAGEGCKGGMNYMGWWAGEPLCQGDQGADIIEEALDKLNVVWAENWGRRIKREEVVALVDFCIPSPDEAVK